MNPSLAKLQSYPFEKLNTLKSGITPPEHLEHISLSIGEPKHAPPDIVLTALQNNLHCIGKYAATKGLPALRESIRQWLINRFKLAPANLNAERHILPVCGTREALFAFAQTIFDTSSSANKIFMPNPFYQIYEGATLLAGGTPNYLNCLEENNFIFNIADFNSLDLKNCRLLYICNPGNPTGAVISIEQLKELIELAQKYNFVIASDECYSELYFDEASPPPGILQACESLGLHNYDNCVAFHSLSKRSNVPGLRSGFVAGDAAIIKSFLLYRTYHGCAMPMHTQMASIAAWNDEEHVIENRRAYRQKFLAVTEILSSVTNTAIPEAGFYLWFKTPGDDQKFAQQLYEQQNITVLPGSFLARPSGGINPGEGFVRIALVATLDECEEAAQRIKTLLS